jgi:uncharacterized repeat protein (TIGR01451 family)
MLFRTLACMRASARLATLAIAFLLLLAFCLPPPASAQRRVVRNDVQHDLSPPLRDLAKLSPKPESEPEEDAEELHVIPLRPGYKPAEQPDLVLQSAAANAVPAAANPELLQNFDGIGQGVANFIVRLVPPDTNGAVGLTQYVQWVNANFAVFDKATGSLLLGPVTGNTLWTGFGGGCESNNDGDPIIMYDKLADRWVFSQFVVRGAVPPFLQCVAVSKTSDATGQFFRYSFPYTAFDDYPKMGLWPDAYYVTFNMFAGVSFLGTDACAYQRDKMLIGDPAIQICFQQAPSVGGVLPSDMDGHALPPPGSPNYMVEFDVDSLNLYKFHVDFATPSNSTFSAATNIPVSPFTPLCGGSRGCVPQQGTGTRLDSLADRLMYRLAYRNFGDHESLVVNHSVAATVNGSSTSGVRWYEIQNPNASTPTLAQQGTFAPDASFRWMGSIAMDQAGDMALGYSVSSSTMFPSIAFTTRTPSDPPGTMQAETSIISGLGSEIGTTRWGDYSAMQVDPVDDCTFWYTTEYFKNTSSGSWNTRIASFKFPECDKPDMTITSTHTGDFTQDQVGAAYTLSVRNAGGKDTDGSTVTVTDSLPTGVTVTAASGTGWTCTPGSTTTCTRNDVLASRASYPDIVVTVTVVHDAAGIITNAVTVAGGGERNTSNDSASDPTTVIQLGPDPTISKSHTGTFIQGQTGTYTIIVKNAGLSALDGTAVTMSDTLPTGLTANVATGAGWTCVLGPPVSCTRSDALASNASYPPITLTVNVAGNAPLSVVNTATVSGGGNVNTLNDTATDPTKIVPPPPNLSITKSHSGSFNQGQTSAFYTVTVSNAAGSIPTSGTVTVTDTLPTGLSFGFAFGAGWFCVVSNATATCSRSDALAGGGSYPAISLQVNVANNAPASVTNTVTVSGGGDVTPGNNTANDPTTINPSPDLTITKTHSGDFTVGQNGTYTIAVSNVGNAPTSGTVTVTDSLPIPQLTATAITGAGWSCSTPPVTFVTCTRSDALAVGNSYPVITLTVAVASGPSVANTAGVSGGGEFNTANDSASDPTNIIAPSLSITKSHVGNFTVGQSGTYTITVSNVGPIATTGTSVGVTDSLPFGLTATSVTGTGWSCSGSTFVNCTTLTMLPPSQSYPPITLTVAVGGNVSSMVFNSASVSGGGDSAQHTAQDPTTINLPDLAITKTHSGNFTAGQTGAVYTITVSNVGTVAAAGGTVTVQDFIPFGLIETAASGTGWTCPSGPTTFVICSRPAGILAPGDSYPPITLSVDVSINAFSTIFNTANVSGINDANSNNNSSSDSTTIVQPVAITPTSPTIANVNAGTAATFNFMANLSTNPPAGTVMFSVTGLPLNAKATFSSSSITQTGSVTLTVDTSGNGHVAFLKPLGFGRRVVIYAAVLFPLFAIFLLSKQKRTRAWVWAGMCICGLALILSFSGCGGGSSPPPPPPVLTPPGTYFVRMTATSSNGSVQPVTMQFTVIVK